VTPALPGGCPGSADAVESPPLVDVVSSSRSVDAQVFRASARHRKRDPVGCGEVLSALILILAAWLFGVPVAAMAVTGLVMWRDKETGTPPRTRYRIRWRRPEGRCGGRTAHHLQVGKRVRARRLPCRALRSDAATAPITRAAAPTTRLTRGRTRGHATQGRGARSLCRRGRRRPLRGR
jgi:hypothetical protein